MSDLVGYLGNIGNCAVVAIPGRRYPGVVFQGDTLSSYVEQLNFAIGALKERNLDAAIEECADLMNQLNSYLEAYKKLCKDNECYF